MAAYTIVHNVIVSILTPMDGLKIVCPENQDQHVDLYALPAESAAPTIPSWKKLSLVQGRGCGSTIDDFKRTPC